MNIYFKKREIDLQEYFKYHHIFKASARDRRKIVFLDTETTGFDPHHDELLSASLVECTYDAFDLSLISVDRITEEYREPTCAIPPKISALTGLTNDNLRGKKFNDDRIYAAIKDADYLIAHNADFDHAFLNAYDPIFNLQQWKSTLKDIEWNYYVDPYISRSLQSLCDHDRISYKAHNATNDALAVIYLLSIRPRAVQDLLAKPVRSIDLIMEVPQEIDPRYLQKRGYFAIGKNKENNNLFCMKVPSKKVREEIKWLRKFFKVEGEPKIFRNIYDKSCIGLTLKQ